MNQSVPLYHAFQTIYISTTYKGSNLENSVHRRTQGKMPNDLFRLGLISPGNLITSSICSSGFRLKLICSLIRGEAISCIFGIFILPVFLETDGQSRILGGNSI